MDPLESYRITLRNLLGAALREHRGSRRWHYAIDMEDSQPDSLASYLQLKKTELRSLLLASGLAHLHGTQFRMNRSEFQSTYSWQQFLVKQSLDGYFDSTHLLRTVLRSTWQSWGPIEQPTMEAT